MLHVDARGALQRIAPGGYRAARDTVPCGIPCRAGYRAARDTVPGGRGTHLQGDLAAACRADAIDVLPVRAAQLAHEPERRRRALHRHVHLLGGPLRRSGAAAPRPRRAVRRGADAGPAAACTRGTTSTHAGYYEYSRTTPAIGGDGESDAEPEIGVWGAVVNGHSEYSHLILLLLIRGIPSTHAGFECKWGLGVG